jgi:hypothetical protein
MSASLGNISGLPPMWPELDQISLIRPIYGISVYTSFIAPSTIFFSNGLIRESPLHFLSGVNFEADQ